MFLKKVQHKDKFSYIYDYRLAAILTYNLQLTHPLNCIRVVRQIYYTRNNYRPTNILRTN